MRNGPKQFFAEIKTTPRVIFLHYGMGFHTTLHPAVFGMPAMASCECPPPSPSLEAKKIFPFAQSCVSCLVETEEDRGNGVTMLDPGFGVMGLYEQPHQRLAPSSERSTIIAFTQLH